MREPAKLKDLTPVEQIRYWHMLGLWTIDESALIMAAIDPSDCNTRYSQEFESASKFAHWEQFKFANIARRSIISAIAMGELSPFELWIGGKGSRISIAPPGYVPSYDEVETAKTRIKPQALGVWLRNKGHQTFRQIVQDRTLNCLADDAPPAPLLQIECRQYRPRYDNPALTVANCISADIWDKVEPNEIPPKTAKTKEIAAD